LFFSGLFLRVRSGHYQPLVIIADDDTGDDDNKANEDDNGDQLNHAPITEICLSACTLTAGAEDVKKFMRKRGFFNSLRVTRHLSLAAARHLN
jgi:hypothetical protein